MKKGGFIRKSPSNYKPRPQSDKERTRKEHGKNSVCPGISRAGVQTEATGIWISAKKVLGEGQKSGGVRGERRDLASGLNMGRQNELSTSAAVRGGDRGGWGPVRGGRAFFRSGVRCQGLREDGIRRRT